MALFKLQRIHQMRQEHVDASLLGFNALWTCRQTRSIRGAHHLLPLDWFLYSYWYLHIAKALKMEAVCSSEAHIPTSPHIVTTCKTNVDNNHWFPASSPQASSLQFQQLIFVVHWLL